MGRRGNGEGSVYRDGDSWRVAVTQPDGSRVRRRTRTQAEALKVRDALMKDRPHVVETDDTTITVGEWLEHWLREKEPNLKPETYRKYRQHIDTHLAPTLGSVRLCELRPLHVTALHEKMRSQGLTGTTIGHVHATLHSAIAVAVKQEVVSRNVVASVDKPKRTTEEQPHLSPWERTRLLESCSGKPYEARVMIALLGLRQGEALGLVWSDIDLDAGMLRVSKSLSISKKQEQLSLTDGALPSPTRVRLKPKTSKSVRTIYLDDEIVRVLRALRKAQQADYKSQGIKLGRDADFVFPGKHGGPRTSGADWEVWQRALRKAGLPRYRLHDARGTFATALLDEGVDAKTVADALGHSSLQMLHQRYGHYTAEQQIRVRDAASRGIFGASRTGKLHDDSSKREV